MIDYEALCQALDKMSLSEWASVLPAQIDQAVETAEHGDLPRWQDILNQLPEIRPTTISFSQGTVTIGRRSDCAAETLACLESLLKALHPWRKGPYDLFGIRIDSEWRSDLKWDRFSSHIQPLLNRRILDVGCGNGYHCWRMLGARAKLVIGIDPTWLSVMQFHALRYYAGECPIFVLPLGIEDLPPDLSAFDTVFSMGVLYHRRSPLDHLLELKSCLKKGGELVLETLVIDGGTGASLVPEGRYAKMRNVWFIPSCETLISWLRRCGFDRIRLIDINTTTSTEQRATEWMRFQSLAEFLDSKNPALTREGLPAPKRAIFLAENP